VPRFFSQTGQVRYEWFSLSTGGTDSAWTGNITVPSGVITFTPPDTLSNVFDDGSVLYIATVTSEIPQTTTYISDLPYTVFTNGRGCAERDSSAGNRDSIVCGDGDTITLNGQAYAKGLGVQAHSEVVLPLDGQFNTFVSDAGVD
jgi:hypothetical protein